MSSCCTFAFAAVCAWKRQFCCPECLLSLLGKDKVFDCCNYCPHGTVSQTPNGIVVRNKAARERVSPGDDLYLISLLRMLKYDYFIELSKYVLASPGVAR